MRAPYPYPRPESSLNCSRTNVIIGAFDPRTVPSDSDIHLPLPIKPKKRGVVLPINSGAIGDTSPKGYRLGGVSPVQNIGGINSPVSPRTVNVASPNTKRIELPSSRMGGASHVNQGDVSRDDLHYESVPCDAGEYVSLAPHATTSDSSQSTNPEHEKQFKANKMAALADDNFLTLES